MFKQRGSSDAGVWVFILVVMALIFVGAAIFGYFKCHAQWDESAVSAVSYGPIKGCMIKLPDGRWLPAERVREVDLPKKESK